MGAVIPIPPPLLVLAWVVSMRVETSMVSTGISAEPAESVDAALFRSACVRRVRCAARRALAFLVLSCCAGNAILVAAITIVVAGVAAKTRCAVTKPSRICENSSVMATKRVYLTLKLPKISIIFCTFADKSAKPLKYDGCPTLGAMF